MLTNCNVKLDVAEAVVKYVEQVSQMNTNSSAQMSPAGQNIQPSSWTRTAGGQLTSVLSPLIADVLLLRNLSLVRVSGGAVSDPQSQVTAAGDWHPVPLSGVDFAR